MQRRPRAQTCRCATRRSVGRISTSCGDGARPVAASSRAAMAGRVRSRAGGDGGAAGGRPWAARRQLRADADPGGRGPPPHAPVPDVGCVDASVTTGRAPGRRGRCPGGRRLGAVRSRRPGFPAPHAFRPPTPQKTQKRRAARPEHGNANNLRRRHIITYSGRRNARHPSALSVAHCRSRRSIP